MAWLESLAAKQGVSEDELLTRPEERDEAPPDWVQQAVEEAPAAEEPEAATPPEETGTTEMPGEEAPTQQEEAFPPIEPPPWLSDGEVPEDDELSWVAPDISESDELLDLNEASLIQLERIPGVGFRRARAITSYRDTHGDFKRVDELYNVPGLDDETIEMLKGKVTVAAVEITPEPEIPPEETIFETAGEPEDALEARQREAQAKLMANDIPGAVTVYDALIKKGQRLDAVIDDLQKATEHFPNEVELFRLLGDACMQANRLDEALDAYTRAETLL